MQRRWLRAVATLAYLLFLFGLLEAGSRAFWAIRWGVPFLHPNEAAIAFYPELRADLDAPPRHDDAAFDVLLLSGSALNVNFGPIGQLLAERLTQESGRPVRVHNLSMPGHTTLDSLYKYQQLAGASFDLVAVYHGLNELRANNVPPERFRADYSHYGWYEIVRDVVDQEALYPLAAPYSLRFAIRRSLARLGLRVYVPVERPRPEWVVYGREVRSREPFRRNLEAIAELAHSRGERVALMTYASHIAPGYSEEKFAARALDYVLYTAPIDLWGNVENVRSGLAAHNAVVRELVTSDPQLEFADIEAAIPDDGRYYDDICHFTVSGAERFVEALLPAALRVMRGEARPGAPATRRDRSSADR